MDPGQMLWWTFFVIALVLDVALWAMGLLLDVGSDSRLRLLMVAAVLLFVVLGMFFGWAIAAAIWFVGLWIYAIIAGTAEANREARS